MITSLYHLMLLIENVAHIGPSSRTQHFDAIASACTGRLNDALAIHRPSDDTSTARTQS